MRPGRGPAPRMGRGGARRYDCLVRRYFTPRCMGMHVTLLILLPVFAWLTKWQLDRALGGNTLSWAYTFEWPLFAGYAVYVWWQLIHDQTTAVTRRIVPGSTGGDGSGDDSRQPGWALSGGRAQERGHRGPVRRRRGGSAQGRAIRRSDTRRSRPAGGLQPLSGRTGRRRWSGGPNSGSDRCRRVDRTGRGHRFGRLEPMRSPGGPQRHRSGTERSAHPGPGVSCTGR